MLPEVHINKIGIDESEGNIAIDILCEVGLYSLDITM